jgi:TonB family protein
MGPLFFDPEGADFTNWINHFKNEVYRNWTVPPIAMAFSGHVDLEFTVLRSGKMIEVEMVKSSGVRGFDNAARFALLGARLLELPDDFGPDRLKIQVSFHYGRGPRSS